VAHWTADHHDPHHDHHGSALLRTMKPFEDALHHFMQDYGVRSQLPPAGDAPPPDGGGAPPPPPIP
ncbi:MAG: hypothetical protein ACREJB_06245, partial [Planctomycetaceae bacterium]